MKFKTGQEVYAFGGLNKSKVIYCIEDTQEYIVYCENSADKHKKFKEYEIFSLNEFREASLYFHCARLDMTVKSVTARNKQLLNKNRQLKSKLKKCGKAQNALLNFIKKSLPKVDNFDEKGFINALIKQAGEE